MSIQTINGTIPAEALGKTYIHEHLAIDLSKQKKDEDAKLDDVDKIIKEMKTLKSKGIDTIVEVTNRGMGRDVKTMDKVWRESGIRIIVSTGFYKEPFLPRYVYEMDDKDLSKILVKDILEGIDDTFIKAHMIGEIGTSKDTIKPMEEKVFRAAIRAHLETGMPISTHTTLGTMALEQLAFFKKYNVDLSKVVIGHLDLNCDLDYHLRVADTGCFMGFDTIGKEEYQTDEKRIECIKELINRGYVEQLVLSQDITRKTHLASNGGVGYSHIVDSFIPKLIDSGVNKEYIEKMLIDNTRRLLDV